MSFLLDDVLSPDGPIARRLGERYEHRPQQQTMANAIAESMARRGRLLVEAGTGVGKSFAYLLPAVERIMRHGERVIVVTNTIALQEQLLDKDVPLLQSVMPAEFSAVLVKGRGNYLSLRRLELASRRQQILFPDAASRQSLHTIEEWAYQTEDGTLATLPQLERTGVWDRVQSDSGNCMGRRCGQHENCYYQRARRRMERGDLLICNHALFCSDLALRTRGVGFLPAYDHVILDEAHAIEDVATEHFGVSLSEGRVHHLLSVLCHPRSSKGFLMGLGVKDDGGSLLDQAVRMVGEARDGAEALFAGVSDMIMGTSALAQRGERTHRFRDLPEISNTITPLFARLALQLRRLRDIAASEEDVFELTSYAQRVEEIALQCDVLLEQKLPGCAYWAQVKTLSRAHTSGLTTRVTLSCSPIDVGPLLREHLFDQDCSVTLTSATLTTRDDDFEHVSRRLGCAPDDERDGAHTLALGSPYELRDQMEVIVERDMPDPRSAGYLEALCEKITEHARATDGGAFVLFTSLSTLGAVNARIRDEMEADGYLVCAQGVDGPRSVLLERFRASARGVLLGAASFWQGVDVRGDALRNVIITKLPFDPPDRPVVEARCEAIRERGGDPFMEDSIPRAVLRFKQGIGRLIRSSSDAGRVVVLDPRVVTKRYGRKFLGAIPQDVPVRVMPDDVTTGSEFA
ncbi:MAG: ATP-dependent DNA helicase [Planctomycetota bacterium]|jgi:ATP-dependent DNA helicase DinG